jgi:hypothetical protein
LRSSTIKGRQTGGRPAIHSGEQLAEELTALKEMNWVEVPEEGIHSM